MYINVDDPGHDRTSANISPCRTYAEYEFAQDVADRAELLYQKIPGIKNVKTKEMSDGYTSLASRIYTAKKVNADLFQSHHSNAAGTWGEWSPARGFGVYVYPGRNRRLAETAHKWCRELLLPFGLPDRGIRERNFYVLREATMPSVLYEYAFHTNQEDFKLLKNDAYRQACAEVSVRTACEYLGVPYVIEEEEEDDDMKVRDAKIIMNEKEYEGIYLGEGSDTTAYVPLRALFKDLGVKVDFTDISEPIILRPPKIAKNAKLVVKDREDIDIETILLTGGVSFMNTRDVLKHIGGKVEGVSYNPYTITISLPEYTGNSYGVEEEFKAMAKALESAILLYSMKENMDIQVKEFAAKLKEENIAELVKKYK